MRVTSTRLKRMFMATAVLLVFVTPIDIVLAEAMVDPNNYQEAYGGTSYPAINPDLVAACIEPGTRQRCEPSAVVGCEHRGGPVNLIMNLDPDGQYRVQAAASFENNCTNADHLDLQGAVRRHHLLLPHPVGPTITVIDSASCSGPCKAAISVTTYGPLLDAMKERDLRSR